MRRGTSSLGSIATVEGCSRLPERADFCLQASGHFSTHCAEGGESSREFWMHADSRIAGCGGRGGRGGDGFYFVQPGEGICWAGLSASAYLSCSVWVWSGCVSVQGFGWREMEQCRLHYADEGSQGEAGESVRRG